MTFEQLVRALLDELQDNAAAGLITQRALVLMGQLEQHYKRGGIDGPKA